MGVLNDPRESYTGSGDDHILDDGLSESAGFLDSVRDTNLGSVGYDQVPRHSRNASASYQGAQNGEGIGSLVRLVEALEMYDNGAMESYMTDESLESQPLKGSMHRHKRSIPSIPDDQMSYGGSEMILASTRKGPITNKMLEKFVQEDMDDEYCALPFNHDPEYANVHVMPTKQDFGQATTLSDVPEDREPDGITSEVQPDGTVIKKPFWKKMNMMSGKNPLAPFKKPIDTPNFNLRVPKLPRMKLNLNRKGGGMPKSNDEEDPRPDLSDPTPYKEWPLRPYRRQVKINYIGLFAFVANLACLVFYLWVRITKTLGLGSYVWYGWLVLVVEILGATTTILYGLNILFDPVHEDLPLDPDNPGLTSVIFRPCPRPWC